MADPQITNLPALCGSIQNLTNPDFCGIGVLASYTVGVILVFLHQGGFTILECLSTKTNPEQALSQPDNIHALDHSEAQFPRKSEARPYQLGTSLKASSVSLFETAVVLAISWQIAALLTLNSPSSVQTTHDVLLVCVTSYASIGITLGALCTSFEHIRRQNYRFLLCLLSLVLCAPVTGMAQHLMVKDDFPKEICLPFFNDYKSNMRKYFVVLSVVFWASSLIMVALMCLPSASDKETTKGDPPYTYYRQMSNFLISWKIYITIAAEMLLLIMITLVNHHWVPEQVLRAEAGGQLAESQWSFGQIVGMLIWLPVISEFSFVFFFGAKVGLEGQLPVGYTAVSQTSEPSRTLLSQVYRMSVGKGTGENSAERLCQVL